MLRAPFALIWNLLKLLSYGFRASLFWLGHFLTRKKRKWVRLNLPKRLRFGPPAGLASYFQDTLSFVELREHIEILADDERIEGVIITADHLHTGLGTTADLRAMIERLRQSGKSIIFHTHSIQGRTFDLAINADEILMTPGGRLYVFGHRFEQFFAAPLLERLGVAPQFVHIGPFKGAAHRFIKSEGTPALRLMMEQMVESLSEIREERLIAHRKIARDKLDTTFEKMPLDDRQALAIGLIDGRIHRRYLGRWIHEGPDVIDTPAPPEDRGGSSADTSNPRDDGEEPAKNNVAIHDAKKYVESSPGPYRWSPLFRKPRTIAAVDLSGMIVMPEMEVPGHSAATIDPNEVLPVLHRLAVDRRVGSVILHINSPGGSALASELLWDGIRRLRYEKPTIAYCSDVAASGGYYMAVAADRIICQPETITGSIGVIAGKFSVPGVLDKLDINSESFRRHDSSHFQSLSEPLSEQSLANLQRDARSFYRQFLRRVGDARQLPRRRLHRYARGRIYSGTDAKRRFLVDHLGGFEDAVEMARSLAEPTLSPKSKVVFHPHRQVSIPALIRQSASTPSLWTKAFDDLSFLHALVGQNRLLAMMPYRLDSALKNPDDLIKQ